MKKHHTHNTHGNNVRITSIILTLFIFLLSSCNLKEEYEAQQIVKEWKGRKIVFLDNPVFTYHGIDTTELDINSPSEYKILVYVDSTGCANCKMKLEEWKEFISHINSETNNSCQFLFFIHAKHPQEMSYIFKRAKFDIPVCIDSNDRINTLNKFPKEQLFQTFLLNQENEVIYVGNPIYSPAIRSLYEKEILGEEQTKLHTSAIVKNQEINIGTLNVGEYKTAIFEIKNTGELPLVINDVSTSCDCTSIRFDKKPIPPSATRQIEIGIRPKESGFFSQTIIVKCNIRNTIKLHLLGNAK